MKITIFDLDFVWEPNLLLVKTSIRKSLKNVYFIVVKAMNREH